MLPGSWLGPDPSKAASEQPVTSQKSRSNLSSEYKQKFRPFSDYSYVDGQFSGARDAPDGDAAGAGAAPASNADPWYEEVVELRKKASSYKVRGWGREMAEPHLVHLYSNKEEDPTALAERKIISALYLETLKPGFVREERGRSPVTTGGAGVRQQSHPPPSSRKSPGVAKMALKLQPTEGGRRPHSAQPASERQQGDTVDRAKGRSPATPRTPTSKTTSSVPAASKAIKKRPSTERPPPVVEKPTRPAPEKTSRATAESRHVRQASTEKADKPSRPSTAKQGKAEKTSKSEKEKTPRPAPAQDSSSGTPESGRGIRGGTPRSRSAHRLASAKAKSPTKEDKSAAEPSMTTSAPAASAPAPEEPEEKPAEKVAEEIKPAEAVVTPQPQSAPEAGPESASESQAEDAEAGRQDVVRSAPEPTRVKSPDGMAPIKSPEPVNWTVPLDTGKTFTVTQNVIGGHGSPQSSRADSLRSPGEDPARSPYQRAVTDVSHLRNGEVIESPLAQQHTNGDDPQIRDQEQEARHRASRAAQVAAEDPMSTSMTAEDLQKSLQLDRPDDIMQGSFHAPVDPMAASITGEDMKRSLDRDEAPAGQVEDNEMHSSFHADHDPMQRSFHAMENPMTASMTGDELKRSLHTDDQMSSSMAENDLKHSFQKEDPMTASMTGDDLQRSFHAADPMTASMTGGDLQRSFLEDEPLGASHTFANETSPPGQKVPEDLSQSFSKPGTVDPNRSPVSGHFSSGSTEPAALPSSYMFSSGSSQPAASLFGTSAAEPATQPASSSLFSSSSAEPVAKPSSMFSSGSAAPPPAAGMFSTGSAQPASGLFSSGSAEPASSLFSAGSAGPPRFSSDLFGSSGRQPAEAKPEAPKGAYRVI